MTWIKKGLMQKIKIYIVTYKNSNDLNKNLESLFKSDIKNYNFEISIINNHSEFSILDEFKDKVNVLHNVLRPDFSTGHLARNWNQAIINGFKDLNNPDCDILVHAQDDVIFKPDWASKLIEFHKKYTFITMGVGDALCSYLPEAVKKIGLWDERFCNIGFQEGDYFLRALIYNRDKSSINDRGHGRLLNYVDGNEVFEYEKERWDVKKEEDRVESALIIVPFLNEERKSAHKESMRFHHVSENLFKAKWGEDIFPSGWSRSPHNKDLKVSLIRNFVYYPFFEKDIEGMEEKNYLLSSSLKKDNSTLQYGERIANLENTIKEISNDLRKKDDAIHNYEKKLKFIKNETNKIFDSKSYKYFARPLNLFKKRFKKLYSKI